MARTRAALPPGSRITDYISLGVIAHWFPRHAVDRVLRDCGRASRRQRDLPAPVMVYYVIALALYMQSSYREGLRCLLEGLQWLQDPAAPLKVAGDSGISQARSRLIGGRAGRAVARRVGATVGDEKDVRIVLSGMAFGFARRFDARCRRSGRQPHGVRLSGRLAGSQRIPATALRLVAGERHARAVRQPHGALREGRDHARQTGSAGAREGHAVLGGPQFPRLSAVAASTRDGRAPAVASQETSALGRARALRRWLLPQRDLRLGSRPAQAPAVELAALYSERWEIEGALDELKTHLRGARIVLRSKTPELVRQEFYGLLMAHFAIRGLMHEAALRADEDPDRLSYLHAVRVVRRKLARAVAIPPSGQGSV